MKATELGKRYDQIVGELMELVREQIKLSQDKSYYHGGNAIKIHHFEYAEIGVINDRVQLLDFNGQHYDIELMDTEELIKLMMLHEQS